jgi:hypothetical protein
MRKTETFLEFKKAAGTDKLPDEEEDVGSTGIKSMFIEISACEVPDARAEYLGLREVAALALAVKDRIIFEMDEGATAFESAESMTISFYAVEMLLRALSDGLPEDYFPSEIRDFYLGGKSLGVHVLHGGKGSLVWQ